MPNAAKLAAIFVPGNPALMTAAAMATVSPTVNPANHGWINRITSSSFCRLNKLILHI
jgi:hypothetical protein